MQLLTPATGEKSLVTSLRQQIADEGYFYLRGFFDPAEIDALASEVMHRLARIGWLDRPDSLHIEHRNRRFVGESFSSGYAVLQSVESFHALGHHPRLLELMEALFGDVVFCHPARVGRVAFPRDDGEPWATRPHQDFVVLHVSSDVLTTWIPFVPCDEQCRGLSLIPGSHLNGYRAVDPGMGGARPLYLSVDPTHAGWRTAWYQPGDLVVFHSLLVHGAHVNTSSAVRLSGDFRYQLVKDPIRPEFLHPHGWPRTPDWDELGVGWSSLRWTEVPGTVPVVSSPWDLGEKDWLPSEAPPSRLLSPSTHT
jgi:hypothetical protein